MDSNAISIVNISILIYIRRYLLSTVGLIEFIDEATDLGCINSRKAAVVRYRFTGLHQIHVYININK